jgi:hypothetical protein
MYSSSLLNGHVLCSSWWMVCGWSMLKMKLTNNSFTRSSKEVALVITTTGPDSVTCSYLENVFHTLCTCPFSSYTTAMQELNDGSYLVSCMIKALYSTLLLFILKTWRQKLENSYADIHYVMIFHRVMYHASAISYRQLLEWDWNISQNYHCYSAFRKNVLHIREVITIKMVKFLHMEMCWRLYHITVQHIWSAMGPPPRDQLV